MAKDYLCRIRLDRAGEKGKAESGAIETGRFYARLTDNEVVPEGMISLSDFLGFAFEGTNKEQNAVDATKNLLDALTTPQAETETTPQVDYSGATCDCPLCKKILVTNPAEGETVPEDAVKDGKKVEDINKHIKTCSVCNRYYCDGDGTTDIYTDPETEEVATVPLTYLEHNRAYGHLPVAVETERQPSIVNLNDIKGKSLIQKFKVAAYTLDGKSYDNQFAEDLNSYVKEYTTETTYLSYKYEVTEKNGGYVLRCKIEFTPTEHFLKRSNEYKTIEELDAIIDKFLTYTMEDDLKQSEDNQETETPTDTLQ